MKSARPTLTAQELEIMKVVWKLSSPTVRQVYEELLSQRRIAYTTVMTMMNILEQKGYLKKTQGERAFVYTPSKPAKNVIGDMVKEFVDRVFNGAAEPLLLHLMEEEKLTAKDLEDIRRTIRKGKKTS
jgi:BlaI family transcriptional regulator, penicillinase repressor